MSVTMRKSRRIISYAQHAAFVVCILVFVLNLTYVCRKFISIPEPVKCFTTLIFFNINTMVVFILTTVWHYTITMIMIIIPVFSFSKRITTKATTILSQIAIIAFGISSSNNFECSDRSPNSSLHFMECMS